MSAQWDSLPLLPLRCVLEHLSLKNVLAATSTCRHWRQAMLLYEGRRNILNLRVNKNMEKNIFLARLFRKHTKKLHIYMNCTEEQLNKFMTFVLPHFFEAVALQEVIFIGPIYLRENTIIPLTKLNRVITESLVFKHSNFMTKLAIIGCEMDVACTAKNVQHKQVEYYSRPLSFPCVSSPEDSILSRCNIDMMLLSSLRHIIFDYEQISTEALETLSKLNNLRQLSLNLIYNGPAELPSVDWHRAMAEFEGSKPLFVAVNIINMPENRFKSIVDTVFVRGMPLTSLKVMFCNTVHIPLLNHVSCMYNKTLRELVWVDGPQDAVEYGRVITSEPHEAYLLEMYNRVNPFVLLCWQCVNLQRLVIHGYWIWRYDLIGFVRLRKTLKLEVSSLYKHETRFGSRPVDSDCVLRVMLFDSPALVDYKYVEEVNTYTERVWEPFLWCQLPNALRIRSTPQMRSNYVIKEVLKNLNM